MTGESRFIGLMRKLATHPAARGLEDDCAILAVGGETIILTHDMMVGGVHFLSDADPADVAWKLVARNLSDLAAKGAEPICVLLGFQLGDDSWNSRFAEGLGHALQEFGIPLLGGDTVAAFGDNPQQCLGLTAVGRATAIPVPARSGAQAGDCLFVTGTLGDAMAGFELAKKQSTAPKDLIDAFNRPQPLLVEGRALAPLVSAMMDISDGLLLDASRMARASRLSVTIDLAAIALSEDFCACRGDSRQERLAAASWGDDYQLLFAAPAGLALPIKAEQIGAFAEGEGLILKDGGEKMPLPDRLGHEHG